MKLSWIKHFVLIILLAALVACGSPEQPAPEPTDAPVAEEEAAPEEEVAVVEEEAATEEAMEEEAETFSDTIVIWADDTRAPILAELAEGFQSEYGIGLDVQQVPDINDQFPIAAPAGEGPDILILAHDRIGGFYASGLLAPLDMGGREGEFLSTAISAFTYEGELVGMPYAVENLAFFYNADMVESVPTTWADAMDMGSAMIDSGDATYALALTGTTYDMYPLQTAFGGYVFGRDSAGNYNPEDVGIDSEGMIAAGDFLAENIEAGLISNSTDWDTAHLQFETGEIPFLMAGPWALDRLRESGVNYGIAGFPDGGAPFLGVQGFAVNALSDNVLLAQTFLTEFVATADVMQALADSGNRPSAFTAITQDDADLVAFNEAGVDAQPMPAIPEMGSVWGSWGDAFTLILSGESEASDALTNGATQVRALIGGAAVGMINIPGSWQSAAGFDCEWAPDCTDTALADNGDGTYVGTFDIPAGNYEVKVAHDGAWTENYGIDGAADGDNYVFTLDADSIVTFTYDLETHVLDINMGEGAMMGDVMASAEEECMHDMSGQEIVLHQQAGREGPLASILGDGFALATIDIVNYINDNGGICGAEVVVEFCETNYNPEMEVACYEQFRAADPKPVMLFTYGSGATIALKDRVVEDKIPNLAAGLNADAFYNPADGYTFGAAPIYSDQFAGFVEFVSENWADIKPADAGDDIVVGVIGWANAFGAGATTENAIAYAES
ncbi:MAG: extracellular solute-binding protein, partial [Candidatus Promineifilaceae bacterium]